MRSLLSANELRLAVALLVGLAYVTADVVVQGPMVSVDRLVHQWDGERSLPTLRVVAWPYDHVGQRAVTVPVLLLVAGLLGRRHRTWRPVALAVAAIVGLNVVVGGMKLLVGRAQTETGDPSVLTGGIIYPSGHASNMVLTCAVLLFLLRRYAPHRYSVRLVTLAATLTALTCVDSLYIGSHWVSDLVAGLMVGGLLALGVLVADRATDPHRVEARSPATSLPGLAPSTVLERLLYYLEPMHPERREDPP